MVVVVDRVVRAGNATKNAAVVSRISIEEITTASEKEAGRIEKARAGLRGPVKAVVRVAKGRAVRIANVRCHGVGRRMSGSLLHGSTAHVEGRGSRFGSSIPSTALVEGQVSARIEYHQGSMPSVHRHQRDAFWLYRFTEPHHLSNRS